MNLLQSTLLEFWTATATHLWQSTLVLALLGLLALTLRNAPGRIRNGLWQIGLIKMVIPFSLLGLSIPVWRPGLEAAPGSVTVTLVSGILNPAILSSPPGPAAEGSGPLLLVVLTVLWAITALWLLMRGATVWMPKRYRQGIDPSDLDLATREKLGAAMKRTGIRKQDVHLSFAGTVPGVAGFLHPRIHLSVDLLRSLDDETIQAVLLHEDAHRRRYEPLRFGIQRLVFCLFFYFPPVWILIRQLHDSAELACDEAALDRGTTPDTYLTAFRKVIALDLAPATTLAAMAGGRQSQFAKRFCRIKSYKRRTVMFRHRIVLTAGLAIFCMSFFAVGSLEADHGIAVDDAWRQLEGLNGINTPLTLVVQEVELQEVCELLGDTAGFEVDFHGIHNLITADFGQTTVGVALLLLAAEHGLYYTMEDQGKLRIHGPLLPGVGGVTNPKRLVDHFVRPTYPEPAKKDMAEGTVILQTVIEADGSIENMTILIEDPPDYGFGEAAMEAVGQWRYEPATLDGVPVPVYLTINVQFSLE